MNNFVSKPAQLLTLFVCFIFSSCFVFAEGHDHKAKKKNEITFSSTQVAPGLHVLMGVGGFAGGNIGLSVGKDGVVMIDDSMPPMLGELKKTIAKISKKPIDFLINTHVHGDHTGNNENMHKDGARIVAHENMRNHLLTKGMRGKPVNPGFLPVMTLSHDMHFHLNGSDMHVFHLPNAHTDGDLVINFKNLNVIHAGDILFNGMFPYIDVKSGGSVDGYIAAQKHIISLSNEQTKIIPGHGPMADKAAMQTSLAMLEDSKALISRLIKSGKSEDQIVKENPLAKYHEKWNWGFITTEKMTRQVYKSLMKSNK